MDFCDTQGLIPIEMAMEKLLEAIMPVNEVETAELTQCLGKIVAEAVKSSVNVPPNDNSAMDGFALRAEDLAARETLTLVGQSYAGHPFSGEVQPGQCVRIMTGAAIPKGADTVIMQERSEVDGDQSTFFIKPTLGDSVRRKGEDIAEGDVVLKKGCQITAADIGLIASLGVANVNVFRTPTVALFSTGDELKSPGESLGFGDIYESNRYTVQAMLQRLGVRVIDLGIIADDKEKIREAFKTANELADVVISSGGVSVGEADFTKDILEEQGEIGFWKLAIKPGKPFAFGKLSNSYFFGLPGNPVSAMVTFHQLAVPALRKLMGQTDVSNPRFNATLTCNINKRPGRTDYQRGVLTFANGNPQVCSTGSQGSGILSSVSAANCYIVIPKDEASLVAGEQVIVEPFDSLIGSN